MGQGGFGPARRERARAGALAAQLRPSSEGETAQRAGVTASLRAHSSARAGGGGGDRRCGQTARANRPGRGRKPAASELDGGLLPVARFSAQREVA
jgi:hypothetical protein